MHVTEPYTQVSFIFYFKDPKRMIMQRETNDSRMVIVNLFGLKPKHSALFCPFFPFFISWILPVLYKAVPNHAYREVLTVDEGKDYRWQRFFIV